MPDVSHLHWTELTEFGSMWTADDLFLMPPNAAQKMVGCHPQPGGGLRAFYAVTTTKTGNGISEGATPEVCAGFGLYGEFFGGHEFAMLTRDSGTLNDWQLWELDFNDTTWAAFSIDFANENANSGGASNASKMGYFLDSAYNGLTEKRMVAPTNSTNNGMYLLTFGGVPIGTHQALPSPSPTNRADGPLLIHQSRLVTAEHGTVWFTDPGSSTIGSTNFINLAIAAGGRIGPVAWMVPIPPSDLLVGLATGYVYNIQGDLADPIVRQIAINYDSAWQEPTLTPRGASIIVPGDGVYLLTPDGGLAPISASIDSEVWANSTGNSTVAPIGLGNSVFMHDYLFVPNMHNSAGLNTGVLTLDFKTNAWFLSTHVDDEPAMFKPQFMQADRIGVAPSSDGPGIWVATGNVLTAGTALMKIDLGSPNGQETRNETWEWQSAPFRDPGIGRQVEIREVHLKMRAFNADTSTVVVTVNGTTRTVTLPSGSSVHVLQFRERAPYLDVTIKAKSNGSGIEAPMLEAANIGWRAGHRLY